MTISDGCTIFRMVVSKSNSKGFQIPGLMSRNLGGPESSLASLNPLGFNFIIPGSEFAVFFYCRLREKH